MERSLRSVGRPVAEGAPGLVIRLLLVVIGLGVLAFGLFRLPAIATTHGEIVTGLLLSLAVAAQILVAAVAFPMATRRA